ncbi:MAG: HAD-IIA family hydrolase [Bacilli bacterium]|nr:HAD-IIA family hydrolase [Bacilli bacterium]
MDLKNIEMFLLDMDGTIYLDDILFDGAKDFIDSIIKNHKKYIFMTNNSSKSKIDYINKMKRLGVLCQDDNIFTSGMAMGIYLQENYQDKKVYFLGTTALKEELKLYDVKFVEENPDIVLVGFDRELCYQRLEKACEFLDNGAIFLATNCDLVCPIKDGRYIPDCGSICHMLTLATKKKPTYIGKPNPYMIDILAEKFNVKKENIAVVGDRIYTDITAGYNANVTTICVLSGESTLQTIEESSIKPDYVFNSVKDIIEHI